MLQDQVIADHYLHGDLLQAIQTSVVKLGKTVDNITIDDLAPVDEFHIGGRLATQNFLDQLNFVEQSHILDVGCGLGGAARYVANKYNCYVSGIDLAKEYIETGKALSAWVKMDKRVTLQQESALAMSFKNDTFDGGYMMHVGMNIADKKQLFSEIYRVLRPGSPFGIYDIMRKKHGELTYPVPWASQDSTSILATPDQYIQDLTEAGFEVSRVNNRSEFALDFFQQLRAKNEANGGPPPLGLHTLMKDSTPLKLKNMVDSIAADYIAPVEIITHKR